MNGTELLREDNEIKTGYLQAVEGRVMVLAELPAQFSLVLS